MGAEPVGGTPEEFDAVIDRDIAKWKRWRRRSASRSIDAGRTRGLARDDDDRCARAGRRQRLAENELDVHRRHDVRRRDRLGRMLAQRLGAAAGRQARCATPSAVGRDLDDVGDLFALSAAFAGRHWSRMRSRARPSRRCTDLRARRAGLPIRAIARQRRARRGSRVREHQPRRRRSFARRVCRGGDARRRGRLSRGQARALRRRHRRGRRADADRRAHRAGLDRVFAVRAAVGADCAVMVDCHWRFDVDARDALMRDIAPAAPYWVECLISEHPSRFGAIARLRRLAHEHGIRTAGGERHRRRRIRPRRCAAPSSTTC